MESKIYKPLCFVGIEDVKNIRRALGKIYEVAANDSIDRKAKWEFDVDLLIKQVLDSAIVGGICFFTTYQSGAGLQAAAIGFGLTFLIKLKEYRKIE